MASAMELDLRCSCGRVRGIARDVAPSTINHCSCYCDDCQAFAHFLGRADAILDAHGGTEIAQMWLPFVGVTKAFIAAPAEALGPIRGRGFAKSAKGGRAAVPKDGLPEPLMVARVLAKVVRFRLRKDHERSPMRDAATGKPIVEPRVLTPAEREELRRRCARWRGEEPAGGSA
jgi:hypothetical protein